MDVHTRSSTRMWTLAHTVGEVDTCSAAEGAHGRVPTLALFDFIFVMQR